MKCPNCGKEIANESKFCEYCGTKVKTKSDNKKKTILWVVLACVTFLVALFVGNMIYHQSDAYERNYAKSIYTLDVPNGIFEGMFDKNDRSFRYYDANTGDQIMFIKGGNQFYAGVESLSEWFDYVISQRYTIPWDKSKYTQTTIHGIPALYTIWNNGDRAGQDAVLYSQKSGGYIIMCEYPAEQKGYYDNLIRDMIFSFKEK